MSKKKKNIWPLIKINEYGTPAVWLTHSHWTIIRDTLVRSYCRSREYKGEARARKETKQQDLKLTDSFIWQFCEYNSKESAMELYRIGCQAYFKPEHREEYKHLSPEDLIALGDKLEEKAYQTTLAALQAKLKEAV